MLSRENPNTTALAAAAAAAAAAAVVVVGGGMNVCTNHGKWRQSNFPTGVDKDDVEPGSEAGRFPTLITRGIGGGVIVVRMRSYIHTYVGGEERWVIVSLSCIAPV